VKSLRSERSEAGEFDLLTGRGDGTTRHLERAVERGVEVGVLDERTA
jgi:hypothetical protein